MTLFGNILALLSLIIVVIVSFLSLKNMNRYNRVFTNLSQYVSKDEEGHIVMDERIVAVIDAVGSRLFQSAKMSALQGLSVDSKLEKGLKSAFAKDIIDQKLPIVNLLGDLMGYNVKQYVAKNPDALMQLLAMPQVQGFLGRFMGSQGVPNNPGNRGRM